MAEIKELHDSGERRKFASGAVRDRGGRKPRPDLISPHAQMREGMINTLGAEKYGLRNYEKGMPISECMASLQRHIEQYKRGDTDEDHLAQARWNLGAIIHYEEEIKAGRMDPAIDDMPKYAQCPSYTEMDRLAVLDKRTPVQQTRLDELTKVQEKEDQNETWHIVTERQAEYNIFYERAKHLLDCMHFKASSDTIDRLIEKAWLSKPNLRPTFYVAGPMRGYRFFNFPAFDGAKRRGIALGYNIISPADLDRANGIDPLKWSVDMIAWYDKNDWQDLHPEHKRPDSLREIIRRDAEAIVALKPENGDGIALLLGWEKSIGACVEGPLAKWCGLRIVSAENFETPIEV